ncbi:type II secretion system protein [Uliginosibacterium gangwonense]|uniref:type II secretion system protein n=1 Tax=Uliginosibacterium gangwonense TaxID=392736 RepID=UPI000377ABA9|nr:type II secretion system protein [Uliginosibacterium gangwonense]
MRHHRLRRITGFTLIEIVVVVTVVGILASAAFPIVHIVEQRSRESELRLALRQIRNAIDTYKEYSDTGRIEKKVGDSGYPHSLDELVHGVPDQTLPDKNMIYLLRRLPRDPMYPDTTAPAAQTWGLRSYASPPDNPQAGQDVFDVFSLSEKCGLNGVSFKEW